MYRQNSLKDMGFMSPPMDPATRLMTPHSPYNMDARRNSDVSALSLSSFTTSSDYSTPPTPMYSNSPSAIGGFSANAFDISPANGLQMDFESKTTSFDHPLTSSWSTLDTANHLDPTMSARSHSMFHPQTCYLESQPSAFVGLQGSAMTATQPWYQTTTYPNLDRNMNMSMGMHMDMDMDMDMDSLQVDPSVSMHSVWNDSAQGVSGLGMPTIVPHEAMLSGSYVNVDTSDVGEESYDDTDEPLPEHGVFKQDASPAYVKAESEPSDDERTVRRSICENRTGGKSVVVKREQRLNGVVKRKASTKKSKSKPRDYYEWKMEEDGRVVKSSLRDIYQDTYEDEQKRRRWANQVPTKKFRCNYPYNDDEDVPHGKEICGKLFKRVEHRQRHKRSHCLDKEFPCSLCDKRFNRNDNCWAHSFTHVRPPGKKDGRNTKFSLRQVISVVKHPKHVEKLLNLWRKEVGTEYIPEDEEEDNPIFEKEVNRWAPDMNFRYDAKDAIVKIHCQRM